MRLAQQYIILLLLSTVFMQNYSLQFDGVDDYVVLPNILQENEFSVGGKIVLYSVSSVDAFFQHKEVCDGGYGWLFGLDECSVPNGECNPRPLLISGENPLGCQDNEFAHISDGWVVNDYSFPIGEEFNFLLTKSNTGTVKIYIDDNLIDEKNSIELDDSLINDFYIAKWLDGSTIAYNEMILLSSFYTKTLISEDDINTYNPENDEDIIFNLSFDGNSNNTIYDISGNDNHGTIYGATWVENIIQGCTNPDASNYDPDATEDDGSCCVELWGECYNIEETTELNLSNSGLTGGIPSEIGNLTNLEVLNLYGNQLTGEIPSEIGNLTNLITLDISYNQLTGEIPPEIGNLTNLVGLLLVSNQLSGEIPSELVNVFNSPTIVLLDDNQLTGEFPLELYNFALGIGIYNNNFCPPYPDCFSPSEIESQDTSECVECSFVFGDLNGDLTINILDVVMVLDCIINDSCTYCSDVNEDGTVNVLDIIFLVDVILNQ